MLLGHHNIYSRALSNCSSLVRLIFIHASQLVYTFSGYNHVYGHTHDIILKLMLTLLPLLDIFVVFMVCIRLVKSLFGPCLVISYSFLYTPSYFGVCNNNNYCIVSL